MKTSSFCINCVHCSPPGLNKDFLCRYGMGVDVVTGQPEGLMISCKEARGYGKQCGPDGKLYEAIK